MLTISNLTVGYEYGPIFTDLSISFNDNELIGIIGPNGAGKTTLFNLLTGVYEPSEGTVTLDGHLLNGKTPYKIASLGLSRTFQNIRLFSNMSVLDNVKVGLHNSIRQPLIASVTRLFGYRSSEKKSRDEAMELLAFFKMEDMANRQAGSLPYGAQRRLEIARALATHPGIILLDEPAAGMNPSETAELMENIRRIRDNFKIAVMLIEHDMNLVMNICEGICVLDHGKVIAKGTPDEIKANPTVIEAYLGKKKEAKENE